MEHEVADSREAWEANAVFWDAAMGDASNAFHRQTVRPGVTDLLNPQPGDFVLDVATATMLPTLRSAGWMCSRSIFRPA